jgi:DNA-binding response OmpR family regulator
VSATPAAVRPLALIVDDSLTVRMDLCEAFEAEGFGVRGCANARELRELLRAEPVQLVLLDVQLPDADGIELSRELRSQFSREQLVILLLSAETDAPQRVRGLLGGADDYIGKPYDSAFVIARSRELLGLPRRSRQQSTILIVDDSQSFREQLRGVLEERGHHVLTATSGEEGLRLAAAHRPSALIVDATLPVMDGYALIRRVRLDEALRGTPCLLLTALDGEREELNALEAGADAFARKEESFDALLARLSVQGRAHAPQRSAQPGRPATAPARG